MPIELLLLEFLTSTVFVFILSVFFLLLMARSPSLGPADQNPESDREEQPEQSGGIEDLAKEIERDEELRAVVTPVEIPHIDLPGALAGGGATHEACSKAAGQIAVQEGGVPDDGRTYSRRLKDRRSSDFPVDDDQRTVERRIWLRRDEDKAGKRLLNVADAADMLGVKVEQIYKWLDKADIPFYHVTDGKKKAIRFEVDELLSWYSEFISSNNSQ